MFSFYVRKASLVTLLTIVLAACNTQSPVPQTLKDIQTQTELPSKTIVALGDSLTEGYQLPQSESYPSQLQDFLLEKEYSDYRVVNAGISGDTSLGVLSRLEWILKQKPDMILLVIGANDALRGFDLSQTEKNIAEIIEFFQSNDVIVVLGGMQITENLGQTYTKDFKNLYSKLAKKYKTPFIPFFLEGVAAIDGLNLPDRIHPNKEGYNIIIKKNIWPVLENLLQK
ncbi:MAG: arylesterase [Candidatus Gracilibacteria bacterium]|nr:arylesterase [Candidatus Gracilibacteria bacterium]